MDSRVMRRNITGSGLLLSAVTSKIVKALLIRSLTHVSSAIAIASTRPLPLSLYCKCDFSTVGDDFSNYTLSQTRNRCNDASSTRQFWMNSDLAVSGMSRCRSHWPCTLRLVPQLSRLMRRTIPCAPTASNFPQSLLNLTPSFNTEIGQSALRWLQSNAIRVISANSEGTEPFTARRTIVWKKLYRMGQNYAQ